MRIILERCWRIDLLGALEWFCITQLKTFGLKLFDLLAVSKMSSCMSLLEESHGSLIKFDYRVPCQCCSVVFEISDQFCHSVTIDH